MPGEYGRDRLGAGLGSECVSTLGLPVAQMFTSGGTEPVVVHERPPALREEALVARAHLDRRTLVPAQQRVGVGARLLDAAPAAHGVLGAGALGESPRRMDVDAGPLALSEEPGPVPAVSGWYRQS